MDNPFRFGGIVGGADFCNRQLERSELRQAIDNGDCLFLHSERRMGKTSLVSQVTSELDSTSYLPIYMDAWTTDSVNSFTLALARAVGRRLNMNLEHLLESLRNAFSRLIPSLTVDAAGQTQLQFHLTTDNDSARTLQDVIEGIYRIAREQSRRIVIVIDEFQRVLDFDSDEIERQLRSCIQQHRGVAWFFLGSKRHLLRGMFQDPARPLYRLGIHYPLQVIDKEHWRPFIRHRFEASGIDLRDTQLEEILRISGGHPYYTQHLCHTVWDMCPSNEVPESLVSQAQTRLLEREGDTFSAQWEALTMTQQRLLLGISSQDAPVRPFASEFIKQWNLSTPSTVQRGIEALLTRDLVDRNEDGYFVLDRFLSAWLKRRMAES